VVAAGGGDVGVPVEGRAGDVERFGDLGGSFAAGEAGGRGGDLVIVHDGGPSADAALGAGGGESGHGALVDHVALELGERGHDGEEELAFPGRGVGARQRAGEDPQRDPALVQLVGQDEDLLDRPAQPVELPHREGVPGPHVLQRRGQSGPVALAGGNLVLEQLPAARLGQGVPL
jgi:hypothetical protein